MLFQYSSGRKKKNSPKKGFFGSSEFNAMEWLNSTVRKVDANKFGQSIIHKTIESGGVFFKFSRNSVKRKLQRKTYLFLWHFC